VSNGNKIAKDVIDLRFSAPAQFNNANRQIYIVDCRNQWQHICSVWQMEKKGKERLDMVKKLALYALLLSATLMVGVCMGASNSTATTNMSPGGKNIVDTAIAAGDFKTLVTALQTAGLVNTLNGTGPFTVFAPTDAAFAKLSKATLAALLANKTQLTSVLTYHVVPSIVMSTDLKNGMMVKTLQGENLTIKLANGGVMVNNATVVKADISSLNGVIHAIDTVLMPK
jgi:uncharacterized surface protein with fasciclin (FAS1) repeats